jgi:hypothetical protein
MNTKSRQRLAETKMALSKKYLHLAMICNSKPRRENWLNKSESYRRQAEQLK